MSVLKKYQFPIVFGTLLIGAFAGFLNRDRFLPADMEGERNKLYKEDVENKMILQNHIATLQRQGK